MASVCTAVGRLYKLCCGSTLSTVTWGSLKCFLFLRNLMNFLSWKYESVFVFSDSRHLLGEHGSTGVVQLVVPVGPSALDVLVGRDERRVRRCWVPLMEAYSRFFLNSRFLNLWNVGPFNVASINWLIFIEVIAILAALFGHILIKVALDIPHESVQAILVIGRRTTRLHRV